LREAGSAGLEGKTGLRLQREARSRRCHEPPSSPTNSDRSRPLLSGTTPGLRQIIDPKRRNSVARRGRSTAEQRTYVRGVLKVLHRGSSSASPPSTALTGNGASPGLRRAKSTAGRRGRRCCVCRKDPQPPLPLGHGCPAISCQGRPTGETAQPLFVVALHAGGAGRTERTNKGNARRQSSATAASKPSDQDITQRFAGPGDSNRRRWAVGRNRRSLVPHNGWESTTRSGGPPFRTPGSPPRPASSAKS
jgi:hypothetical protein